MRIVELCRLGVPFAGLRCGRGRQGFAILQILYASHDPV
jgi:hypothetical protein